MIPVDQMFSELGSLTVLKEHAALAYNGNPVPENFMRHAGNSTEGTSESGDESRLYRVYDEDGRFIGIYRLLEKRKEYRLEKMFLDQEELRG